MKKYNFGKDEDYLLAHNCLGITTYEDLENAEQYVFIIRSLQVENGTYVLDSFTMNSLQNLHRHLFRDIYDFAGDIRSVQLAKGTTQFCQFQYIAAISSDIFTKIAAEKNWSTVEEAAKKLAYYKAELNMLHPFREGNGRAIRIFIQYYAKSKGYDWQYANIDSQEYMLAMIASVHNSTKLQRLFFKTLVKL
ncbi:Fic/DOC family protein [Lysinibacillus sp. 54212]|uniref:Fic/DOC family protein n=1 Tax=Lysinibacillus sp. 54212 TaxID=3119829 RepID=UPI002FCAF314